MLRDDGSYNVNAYHVVSFTRQGGALAGYNVLPTLVQRLLIPLPPLLTHHPTPIAFGNIIDLGGFSLQRDSWLLINLFKFLMPEGRAVSLI
jgi:hypothetical protein